MNTNEGCSSISDEQGNLLFYTDGITVWNKMHTPMLNSLGSSVGGQLLGDPSATQSALIVPRPMYPDHYYIFTTDANLGAYGCRYSMVDMSLDAGLGDIDTLFKNIELFSPSSEKLAACMHANGVDIWVVTHPWNSEQFRVYEVTQSGVSTSAVLSTAGSMYIGGSAGTRGYLNFSHGGNMLAAALEGFDLIELFNFDKQDGTIDLIYSWDPGYIDSYGIEFSRNNELLYGTSRWDTVVYQWDLSSGIGSIIANSGQQIASLSSPYGGAMQMARDGMIYIARNNQIHLSKIKYPDSVGIACGFEEVGISLHQGTSSAEGLPIFLDVFRASADFTYELPCLDSLTLFFATDSSFVDSALWNFGDPASGVQNTAEGLQVDHMYSFVGTYVVNLTVYYNGAGDNYTDTLLIEPVPSIDFGADTLINTGTFYTIIPVITGAESYLWNNLAVEPLLAVSYPGWYSLTVSSAGGCSTNDSVYISFIAQVENHFQQALKVYPNPVSEFLHVEISSSQSGTLAIYNSLGLPVNRQKVNGYETTINVQSFSDGIYFIRWENEDRECWMSRFSVVR